MEIIRTPDEHFSNLPNFDYQPNYIQIDDTRMHYLDEGEGEVVLCLHGEPSWSFLYRKFIPILSPQYRVVAPDLIGFGRSDKYTEVKDYSFAMHFQKLCSFVDQMGLQDITLVVQDWGGLLGLPLLGAHPEKFSRVVIMNTALPIGDRPMPKAFKIWKSFALNVPGLPIGKIMQMATASKLMKEVIKAYQAPFPSKKYKAGAKAFPALVPTKPEDPGVPEMKTARGVLADWNKPALVMFSDKDPIMRGGDRFFRKLIPSAKEHPEITIKDAGHFLQEDKGEAIAGYIKRFLEGSLRVALKTGQSKIMDQTYKWGIIGCGKIAHKFAQTLPASNGGKLWAVASRSEDKAKEFASKYQAPKHYGNYEGIVQDPDVEVIYIATPHPMHADNTILCLEAGKAVLCEKAFAMNSAQVKKMIDLAEEKNLFLMEALWSRFIPHLMKVKELIDAGTIGKVKKVQADFGFAAKYDPQSRLFNPDLGGGALLDIGIYPLFLAYYLLGYPEEITASAELSPTQVDQRGEVKLAYNGGSEAELEFTLMKNTPVEANITGTEGEIFIGNRWYMPNDFTLKKNGQEENYHFDYPSNGYHFEANEVMSCLENGQTESQLWSWSDSLQLMKIMDEIRRQCGIVYPKYDLI